MASTPAPTPSFPLDPALYYSRGWYFYQRKDYDRQGNDARALADFDKAKRLGYTGSQ